MSVKAMLLWLVRPVLAKGMESEIDILCYYCWCLSWSNTDVVVILAYSCYAIIILYVWNAREPFYLTFYIVVSISFTSSWKGKLAPPDAHSEEDFFLPSFWSTFCSVILCIWKEKKAEIHILKPWSQYYFIG